MFNPVRLLRRKDHIDEAATAFIEGRATGQDEALLRERAASEPGLLDDLDSLRDTVSLLRSVESVSAPRSFALAHAPAPARRSSRPRLAMAPAVFAIAAAAAVGLLAVGNLADIVHQSDGSGSDTLSTASFEKDSVAAGADGAAELTLSIAPGTSLDMTADSQSVAAATATVAGSFPSPLPTTTQGSFPTAVPSARGPEEPDPGTTALPGELPEGGYGFTSDSTEGLDDDDRELTRNRQDLSATSSQENSTGDGEVLPALPQSTTFADIGAEDGIRLESEDTGTPVSEAGKDRGGFALPLWQLQAGFAAFAVLMAAAWILLQRKLTA